MSPTFFGDLAISLSVYIHAVVANMTGGCRRAVDTGSLGGTTTAPVHPSVASFNLHLRRRVILRSASWSWDVAIIRDLRTRRQTSTSRFD